MAGVLPVFVFSVVLLYVVVGIGGCIIIVSIIVGALSLGHPWHQ